MKKLSNGCDLSREVDLCAKLFAVMTETNIEPS